VARCVHEVSGGIREPPVSLRVEAQLPAGPGKVRSHDAILRRRQIE
jgi:hypothetical protein